jgi:hypothetical protein
MAGGRWYADGGLDLELYIGYRPYFKKISDSGTLAAI